MAEPVKHRSGEWPMGPNETMRMIAAEAAQSATATALTAVAVDNARRDGMIGHVVDELKGLREDLKPIIQSNTQHAVVLEHHENQLDSLWAKKDNETSAIRKIATAAAKDVIRSEAVDEMKESHTMWKGVIPAVVASVVSGVIVVIALYLMGFQAREKDESHPVHPQPVSAPTPGP